MRYFQTASPLISNLCFTLEKLLIHHLLDIMETEGKGKAIDHD